MKVKIKISSKILAGFSTRSCFIKFAASHEIHSYATALNSKIFVNFPQKYLPGFCTRFALFN